MSCVLHAAMEGWLQANTCTANFSLFGSSLVLNSSHKWLTELFPRDKHCSAWAAGQCLCWQQGPRHRMSQDVIADIQGHSLDHGEQQSTMPASLLGPPSLWSLFNASIGPFACHFPPFWLISSNQLPPPVHRISLDNVSPPWGCLTLCLVALLSPAHSVFLLLTTHSTL